MGFLSLVIFITTCKKGGVFPNHSFGGSLNMNNVTDNSLSFNSKTCLRSIFLLLLLMWVRGLAHVHLK
jgi:hypothetical protein